MVMREILSFIIMPFSIFWILLILSGVMLMAKKKKITRWLLFIAIAWLLIISTRFVPEILAARLENRYKQIGRASCRERV